MGFVETPPVHQVYTGRRVIGASLVPFGRCTCGATLNGQTAIDEHRELRNA